MSRARLASVLTALGKAVESGYAWSVYPSEAKTLLAEIERLRAEVDLLRTGREATRCYADRVEAEVEAARTEAVTMRTWAEEAAKAENENAEDARRERAAVVAWLRVPRVYGTDALLWQGFSRVLGILADAIENGEHRREGDE